MGIYRYQRQQDGKLQDCDRSDREQQPWREHDRPASDHDIYDRPAQDWQSTRYSTRPASTQQVPQQPAPQSPPSRSKWLTSGRYIGLILKNLSLLTTGGLTLLTLVGLLIVWRSGSSFLKDIQAFFATPQPAPRVDLRPMVVQQLRNASELTTAVFSMQTVVPASRDRTLGTYVIGRTTLLYIAYGEVRAGVDLSSLNPTDVQPYGETISIRLPPPRILDRKIDVNRSKVYDYDRGFLGLGPDAATELQEIAEQTTLDQIVTAACEQGILQNANERAQAIVTQLLSTAGYKTPMVVTQSPAPDACPTPIASPTVPATNPPAPPSVPNPAPPSTLP